MLVSYLITVLLQEISHSVIGSHEEVLEFPLPLLARHTQTLTIGSQTSYVLGGLTES